MYRILYIKHYYQAVYSLDEYFLYHYSNHVISNNSFSQSDLIFSEVKHDLHSLKTIFFIHNRKVLLFFKKNKKREKKNGDNERGDTQMPLDEFEKILTILKYK